MTRELLFVAENPSVTTSNRELRAYPILANGEIRTIYCLA
jgi:hypothetical protein